jgi:hypothetical protein
MATDDQIVLLAPLGAGVEIDELGHGLQPFAPEVIRFLDALSELLCGDLRARTLPDLY